MASKIKVDQIEGSTASTITLPSGQTLDLSSGSLTLPDGAVDLSTAKVTGILGSGNLPTIPVSKGGTGLTSLGTANQVVAVNSGGTALEFQSASSGKVLGSAQTLYTTRTTVSGLSGTNVHNNFAYPASSNIYMEVSYTKQSATSVLIVMGHGVYKFSTNTHDFSIWETSNPTTLYKNLKIDEHNYSRQYFSASFMTCFTGVGTGAKTFRASPGFQSNRSSTGARNPNMYTTDGAYSDTSNADANSSYIMVMEIEN